METIGNQTKQTADLNKLIVPEDSQDMGLAGSEYMSEYQVNCGVQNLLEELEQLDQMEKGDALRPSEISNLHETPCPLLN